MFKEIFALIDEKEYAAAADQLLLISNDDDEKAAAFANAVLGDIYQRYDFSEKNDEKARRFLRLNIGSSFPQPYAFCLYARVEKDKNIAQNYLQQGILSFPNDARIWTALFDISDDKAHIIQKAEQQGINDLRLTKKMAVYCFDTQKWEEVISYVKRIKDLADDSSDDLMFCHLLEAFALAFCDDPNYESAYELFRDTINRDVNNQLKYANYVGIIYVSIKENRRDIAIKYLDRIPVNNSLCDYLEGPWYEEFYISFENIYNIIFREVASYFSQDPDRKQKAKVLYSLYLYNPFDTYGIYRYGKSDTLNVNRYIKKEYSPIVAAALFNMQCHFGKFIEACETIFEMIKHYDSPEKYDVFLDLLIDKIPNSDITSICQSAEENLLEEDFNLEFFCDQFFEPFVRLLHEKRRYSDIVILCENMPDESIIKSNYAFEAAYALKNCGNADRAQIIYEGIVEKTPDNSSAINNLGVIYEEKGQFQEALKCFQKAHSLSEEDQIHINNLSRIKKTIYERGRAEFDEIAERISFDAIMDIGYSIELTDKIQKIADSDIRELVQRDLKECAISVVFHQDKSATVLCGSIAEAVLYSRIIEKGIEKYDITSISHSKRASSYPTKEMGLNEMLFVAKSEGLLDKNSYHLGHYIRDYRNIIHPAKEIRMLQDVTHENVVTMWNVLKRLIFDLFPEQ